MENYICSVCNFIYDIDSAPTTPEGDPIEFNALDPEWTCPNCGVSAQMFTPIDDGSLNNGEAE